MLFVSGAGHAQVEEMKKARDAGEATEPVIVKLKNLLTFKASLTYNFMLLEQVGQNYTFETNRPWDLGLGIGIKNLFLGFSFSIPFLYDKNFEKSQSYNFNFNHFSKDKSFSNGYFKYYNGFHDRHEHNIDLKIISLGFSQTYILNREHSIKTAYNLDGRQTVSNGSFLVGGGVFFNSIRSGSDNEQLSDYSKPQNLFFFGPNFGYSHTFVINKFFVNVLSTFGINGIVNNGNFSLGFQALPKFSLGYHSKNWTFNVAGSYTFLYDKINTKNEHNLVSGTIGVSYLRRFL